MNNISLLGKNWIYKKYDHDYVNFLKENYLIDEITAKLLSIRNIEKKYIQSFLKPSIKHSITNPYDMKDMNKAIDRIIKAINKPTNI